jgi:hypothetical protein
MTDEVSNLILEMLRTMRGDQARFERKVDALMLRMSAVETGLAQVRKELGLIHETIAHQWAVFDQHGERLERLEKRTGLIEGPTENDHH